MLTILQGTHLNINANLELTPELATSIMSRSYNLRIYIEDLQEDKEDGVLSILRTPSTNNQFRMNIEGHLPICGEEYQHIQNEQCDIAEEMRRAEEYWENHDCNEEEHEDHE